MKASARLFNFFIFLFLFNAAFMEEASARPDRKKGLNFVMTSLRISPKAFAKGYEAEKKEQARLFEKERRRMHHKQNGWKFWRYLTENKRGNNPSALH